MAKQLAGSATKVRLAGLQQILIVVLSAVAFTGLFPQRSPAQQINYFDFNAPDSASPGQTSTICSTNTAPSGVLLCFNHAAGNTGLGFIQDSFPPSIDPNASSDGDAGSTNYALQMTPAAMSQISSAWYATPQNVANGFSVWFTIKLTPSSASLFTGSGTADGLAFVIQNSAGSTAADPISGCTETGSGLSAMGSGGGCIGYGGIDNGIALEFDPYTDAPYDPVQDTGGYAYQDNHMALQGCGPGSQISISHLTNPNCLISLGGASTLIVNPITSVVSGTAPSAVTLADGNPHQIVIVYNGPNDSPANYLYVYLDPAFNPGTHTPVSGSVPLFSGPFNIAQYMNLNNGTAYFGFTSATGYSFEQQEVMGFSFTPHNYASANVCPAGQTTPAPCSATMPVTFTMAANTTISSVSVKVVTQGARGLDFQQGSGNTCTGTISAGNSCTVNVTFAPIAPGLRMGAVELFDGSGNLIATKLIYGIGQGPAIVFGPAISGNTILNGPSLENVVSTPGYALTPRAMATDAAGDLFIADPTNPRVVKLTASDTASTVGVGLGSPQALAVDGAGDLFIADTGQQEVLEVPAGCITSACQTVVYKPSPADPVGLAVDGMGDLFIVDEFVGVVEIPAGCTNSSCWIRVGSGWSSPSSLAIDAAGDLFVADSGLGKVLEMPAGCTVNGCQIKVGSGWLYPHGVAVDAAGDVYVADSGLDGGEVAEVPAGCTSSACSVALLSGILSYDVAVDEAGEVYVTEASSEQILKINQPQPPSESFAATNTGSTSSDSPQSFTIQNVGNQPWDAIAPGLAVSGPNFVQVAGTGTPADCSSTFALTPGAACNVSISFEPQSGGPLSGSAQFFDNALNNPLSSQSVSLSGTGVGVVLTNYTLSVTDAGTGAGTVTDNVDQIACNYANGSSSGSCFGSYTSGSNVTLTANPAAGSAFLGWGGACSGTNPTCVVAMSSAMNVAANFAQQSFGNVNVCATGQTSPSPCNSTLAVTFNIANDTTIGVTQVVTQGVIGLDFALASGGTCTGAISAGNSCTVNVSFTPLAPGLRMGAVNLFDNGGNLIAASPVYGIGQAPEAVFGPGTQFTSSTSALNQPQGVAVDAAGDVFISNYGLGTVLKVTPYGVQTTVPAIGLANPYGVAVDGAGDVFIADPNNSRVVEVTPGGVQTTVGDVGYPYGVAVDGAGDVYIVDSDNRDVVEVTPGGVQTTVPATGLTNPYDVAVDGAGDVFISDPSNVQVIEVTPGGVQTTVPTSGLVCPYGVAVDAAGDVFIADPCLNEVVEVAPNGVQTTILASSLSNPISVAVDATGDVYTGNSGIVGVVTEVQRFLPPSLSFALTNEGSTSTDSPQQVSIQNVGNQQLTGSLALSLGANFAQKAGSTCGSGFSLPAGASCSENFSFTPQGTGNFTGTASFSDNTMNLSPLVVLQTINLSGSGGLNGQAVGVTVPSVVGLTQSAATAALTSTGLTLGTVSTESSDSEPAGSVIGENPAAGAQVTPGNPVALLISTGEAPPPAPNPLSFENNYFVTGDYATGGVTLRGTGHNGMATGTINIYDSSVYPDVAQGVPEGADIIDGYLYWETLENTATPSGNTGTFLGYSITGQQVGSDQPFTDGGLTGTLRVYRADVNSYFPVYSNGSGVRSGSGAFTVSLPDSGGSGFPVTEGASMVVIYRVLSPNFPLKSIVIYDGSAVPATAASQTVQGFYDALGGTFAAQGTVLSYSGGNWNNSYNYVSMAAHASQTSVPLNAGAAYGAVIFSTIVNDSDNDGILDAWKSGPAAGDFFAGQPGYYDFKTQAWVPLPGAKRGEKDLFVQLDYMCGAVLSNGACDPNEENLFPSPDAQGNDPLAIVQNAFAASGVALHLEVGNAVPETTCTDNTSTNPPQLCEFPGQPGVVDWKNSLEISKVWPRNFASCAAGGDCTPRFPYGQKDSYHYVLFGHSLAIPAWNTPYHTLTSITVANGFTTLVTTNRGAEGTINYCPSRFTISGVQGNPSLNGIYNTSSCPDGNTIILSTPGVPNWTYPNNTLPEQEIGLTSGTVTSISGYSDLGGQDSAVTLGLWETAPNQNMSKRSNVIAGTLFHEIGHTLGLTHGGRYYDSSANYIPTYEGNCKPNFQSIMNYLFQLDGVGPNASVAFSNQTLTTLMPSSFGSVTQLTDGSNNAATFPTSAWYSSTPPNPSASPATLHCDGTPLTGDTGYRIDGPIAPITPAWANQQNITFDSITTSNSETLIDGVPYTQLRGYNDVTNIDLRQVGATGGEFASLSSVLNFASPATPLNIAAGGNVTLGTGGTVTLGSGGTVTLGSGANATLGGGGTVTLGSGGTVTLNNGGNVTLPPGGGTVTLGSGGTVTLGSGGTVTLGSGGTITLGSGGTVTLGSGGTVTLGSGGTIALGSGGSVAIPSTGGTYTIDSSGGTVTLGSGGTVALGSGGTVALGSGGTIALGSGGTVALGSGGTIALGSGGTIALGSGGTIALGSGGNITLGSGGTIALGSGGTIALGSGGTVTLGSGGTVTLGSGGTVALGSGGTVTLGSGGTVALGSGGTIALGSGGTIALGSGGTIALGSGGTVTLGSGGTVTLGSGGTVTLGSGGITLNSAGTIALGSGGTVALGSGGTIALGSGGVIALGSGGTIALGSGGTVALGSGGTIALGSGGTVALGSGGDTTNELDYNTANSYVRPPSSPSETPMNPPTGGQEVVVNWTAPAFGVVQTYTIYRGINGGTPVAIGSVSGVNGNPPATTFTDTNPDLIPGDVVVYTIVTTLVPDTNGGQRSSLPSPPAVLKNNETVVMGSLPSSVVFSNTPVTVTATAETNNGPNGLQVSFSATGNCSVGSQTIDPATEISSASVTLTSTGTCTVTASQMGSSSYNAADSVSGTFSILAPGSNIQSQTINFPQLQNVQYGSTFSLSARASSGLTVTFMASGSCTTSGTTIGVGLCTITASAPANNTYSAAMVTQSFSVLPAVIKVTAASPTITYGQSLPSLTYSLSGFVNNDPMTVVSGVPALSTTAVSNSLPGAYPITVLTGTLAAANYSFLYINGTLTIQPLVSITISNLPTNALVGGSFTPAYVYGGSGSPTKSVTSSTVGVCKVSGGVVSFVGAGICILTPSASATNSNPASLGSPQSFTVLLPPTITLTTTATLTKVNGGYQATVTITNTGNSAAANVEITSATLGSPSAASLPVSFGSIAGKGGTVSKVLTFPSSAGADGAAVAEKYSGTCTGGTFSASIRATLP